MTFAPESRRRCVIPCLGIGLAAVYLFAFAPLSRKADSLDAPLEKAWRELAGMLGQTNAVSLDFVAITNQLAETRIAVAALETARRQAQARIEPGEPLRARLNESFQLVEYDSEVSRRISNLVRLAAEKKVTLEPAVIAGFPEQTVEVREPELLWAELEFLDCLLTGAIHAQVAVIHSVSAPALLTNVPPPLGVRTLTELPVQIECSGPAPQVTRFLQSLPLRGEELKAAGLPEAPTNKPALYVDRLVLRKQSPEKRDEVRLSLRAAGFVYRK